MLGAVTTWPRRASSGLPGFVADDDMVDRTTRFSYDEKQAWTRLHCAGRLELQPEFAHGHVCVVRPVGARG